MSITTIIFPEFLLNGMVYVIAGYLLLNSDLHIVHHFIHKKGTGISINYVSIVFSCLLIVLGILSIGYYRYIMGILPIFLGVLMIVESITYFVVALCARTSIKPLLVVLSIFIFIGGAVSVIFTFGFGGLTTLSQIFGVLLLLSAIYELSLCLSRRKTMQLKSHF